MKASRLARYAILVVLCLSMLAFPSMAQEQANLDLTPRQVVLTYQHDPQTSITITWRTDGKGENSIALFSLASEPETGHYRERTAETFTFKETTAWLHTVEITGLAPGEEYRAVLETDNQKTRPFLFRTASTGPSEVTFVIGADAQHLRTQMPIIREIFRKAAKENPDFFVYSGDFVNAELSEYEWDLFFDLTDELLVTDEGRRIPIIPAVGNHEVVNGYGGNRTLAPFYYHRFRLPDPKNYYSILYGRDLLIVSLDSNHTATVDGAQASWLAETLERYRDIPWKIVHYHDGSWWGNEKMYVKMRASWVPLFERYGVNFVHNGHVHSYKRSAPIRGIGPYSEEINKMIKEGLARAQKDFDPSKRYAPPLQRNLMKLSRGDWESTGYASLSDGLSDMIYMLSLFVIQSGDATRERVYDQLSTTKLFTDYWAGVLSPGNKNHLVDKDRGVVYLVGGGLGAEMDPQDVESQEWWIEEAKSEYHFRKVTVDPTKKELTIQPEFYDPTSNTWQEKDATVIRG